MRDLAARYDPPDFAHVPTADAALFLCAIDHKTGYQEAHTVEGRGPFEGSELLWELACDAERKRPGTLSAASLLEVDEVHLTELFHVDGETVRDPHERARLWRELAAGLDADFGGEAACLLAAGGSRLGGGGGLLELLSRFEAYADPLRKKSFLFAKIAERRGWFKVEDPENWEVCADNILMRLALRSGLVDPGSLDVVRLGTRDALKRVAAAAEIPPPVLDDLLWELGRNDPDLLGTSAGRLAEPPRVPGVHYY